ncbi:hypothetical protein ACHAXR_003970 [Thalassiosira sp. AJA248-18]
MNIQLHAAAATPSTLAAALPLDELNKEAHPKPVVILSDTTDSADGQKLAITAKSASSVVSSKNTDDHNLERGTKSFPQVTAKNADTSSPKKKVNAVTNNDVKELLESIRTKNFAEKLHALLSVPAYQTILRWNPSGESFAIYDKAEFVTTVMATHFKRAKFDSFTRRMRRWGFRRTESMEEKIKGLVLFKFKLFLRDKPELCKLMCDDRQRMNKKRAGGSGITKNVQRLMATTDMSSPSLAKSNGFKGNNAPVPVHFPMGHPEHSNWNSSINTMSPAYPPSLHLHQLAANHCSHQAMAMNQSSNQAYSMDMMTSSYPPQDTRNIPGMMTHDGMMPMMQNGTEPMMMNYQYPVMPTTQHHNNIMPPRLHHDQQQQHSHRAVHSAVALPGQFLREQMMHEQYPNTNQGFMAF